MATKRSLFGQGEEMVWFTGGALSVVLLSTVTLIAVVMVNGLGTFWPAEMALLQLDDGQRFMGEITAEDEVTDETAARIQVKVGNRDLYGADFRWFDRADIQEISYPDDATVLEREEFGDFHGFLQGLTLPNLTGVPAPGETDPWGRLQRARDAVAERQAEIDGVLEEMNGVSSRMDDIRDRMLELDYEGVGENDPPMVRARQRLETVRAEFDELNRRSSAMIGELRQNTATFADANGREKVIPVMAIVRAYRPNDMGVFPKVAFYAGKVWELLTAQPRESNTEGGLFPAIFGTVMLVFIMSLFCIPLGVIAAIYLQEYAKAGPLVRAVRIAVFNLAGVPSIVYGIFGLGFFVYGIGGSIDELFYPERLPTPTFGTGGILWASLTLALLTVPVVIVATEEALAAIPKGIREASLSLGATRFQTLWRILVPMAMPGIITGFVLSTARAAGEVAPLMITGVVKLAPALPLDGEFPYLHLERKFMHLGFHIYDVGFQSPNVEAAKPMVFITTLLLLAIVVLLSLTAIVLRNKMQRRYAGKTF